MTGPRHHGLPPATDLDRAESYALDTGGQTNLERLLAADLAAHPGQSGFRLLASGAEAFLMRTALAESAQRTLDLQYYIYREDDTGALLTQTLLKAADRGVRVRLLVDDLNLLPDDRDVAALDAHPHIEVRIFNPFADRQATIWTKLSAFLADPARLNRRMHNKCFIADNICSIAGGRNIGDEYFDASRDFGFGDLDVLAAGPATRELSRSFDQYWNSRFSYPVTAIGYRAAAGAWMERLRARLGRHFLRMRRSDYASRLLKTDLAAQLLAQRLDLVWAKAQVLADPPEKIGAAAGSVPNLPFDRLQLLADHAREDIILVSPYFVPGRDGVEVLRRIRARGVRVRVLTNSLASSDVAVVHAGYSRYRAELLQMGIELYELKPIVPTGRRRKKRIILGSARASLHAKIFVFDRRHVVVGSMNLDPRSVYLNTESALLMDSEPIAGEIAESFDELIDPDYSYRVELAASGKGLRWSARDAGGPVVLRHDPQASIWRRLAVRMLGWLPIESQL
jgi:putative cardiolipin synthase